MIQIVRSQTVEELESARFDRSFLVDGELKLHFAEGKLGYNVVSVAAYEKTYQPQGRSNASGAVVTFLAYVPKRPVGRIDVSVHWNAFAYVHDLVVGKQCRRSGVATALVKQAIDRSASEELPGVMIETQSNNVAACKLYERCGFRLGGFDADSYRAKAPFAAEVALFWYWHSKWGL